MNDSKHSPNLISRIVIVSTSSVHFARHRTASPCPLSLAPGKLIATICFPLGAMTSNCCTDIDTHKVVINDQSGRLILLSEVKWTYSISVWPFDPFLLVNVDWVVGFEALTALYSAVHWKSTDLSGEHISSICRVEEKPSKKRARVLPTSLRFLPWLILRIRRRRQNNRPKLPLTFNGLHCVISQKTELYLNCIFS
jgi:hypothetical protein